MTPAGRVLGIVTTEKGHRDQGIHHRRGRRWGSGGRESRGVQPPAFSETQEAEPSIDMNCASQPMEEKRLAIGRVTGLREEGKKVNPNGRYVGGFVKRRHDAWKTECGLSERRGRREEANRGQ